MRSALAHLKNATTAAVCMVIMASASTISAAMKPPPPMVAQSKVQTPSAELHELILDAQVSIEIKMLYIPTRKVRANGKELNKMLDARKSGLEVAITNNGVPKSFKGFEAVHFLMVHEYLRWQNGVGLVTTKAYDAFGPGVTQAGNADEGASSTAGDHVSSAQQPEAAPTGTTRFTCEFDFTEVSILGKASSETIKKCNDKANALEAKCVAGCAGNKSCIAVCRSECKRVRKEKCDALGKHDLDWEEHKQ